MADVRINSVETQISVADTDLLLTPEMLDKIARALREKMIMEQTQQNSGDDDRQLREGASR